MRLTLGYRGTRYAGWAKQSVGRTAGRPTIQGTLEGVLADVLGHPVATTAAGRTDAGVHAEGQVASFDTTSSLPCAGILALARARLPEDIWLIDAAEAARTFDARRSAVRRWYRYAVWRGDCPPAAWQGRCLAHPAPLDVAAMRRAARHLLGRQDMATLVGGWGRDRRPGRSTVRTVYAADWLGTTDDPLLLFEVCADAFLRQSVRSMVGALLWVGIGRWSPDQVGAALAAKDRRAGGPAAPAEGLTLWRIEY